MSVAYESGILSRFPNATLVWDRFHLAKAVNEALNDVRKKVVRRGKDESLRSVKYVVLTKKSNMDRNRIEKLRVLSM
jgi:Transposase.